VINLYSCLAGVLFQYTKIIQNPSYGELQKAANQGRRCTWEKLSAIKANCGIELALDECVVILNHMRRLRRMAERAASASHGLSSTVRFSASRRIPSWNCIARENSTGSLEDLIDVASSLHQSISSSNVASGKTWKTHRGIHEGSDSDSESVDLHSWTRSGGPLMRTTSANMFIDFLQNLEVDTEPNKGLVSHANPNDFQYRNPRLTTLDRNSDSTESEQREIGNRVVNGSRILVTAGDFLQPERIHNGIVFNVVKKEDVTPLNRSHDFENFTNEIAECVQDECPGKEMDAASSASEHGDDESTPATSFTASPDYTSVDRHSGTDSSMNGSIVDG